MKLAASATLREAERVLTAALRDAGIDTPDLDARLILQARLGLDRAGLLREGERPLSDKQLSAVEDAVARRLAREPLAYILGEKEFWSLPLAVSDETLVPRPETEVIVEAALAATAKSTHPLRIADLGTGTGAILLALLRERSDAYGVGVDRSAGALRMAQRNAVQLGVAERCGFVRADFAAPLSGPFDLIVSNPPYIETDVLTGLAPEVRREPRLALDGGADGLNAYRAMAAEVSRVLSRAGSLVLEIGYDQAARVTALFHSRGLILAQPPIRDLGGHDRALVLQAN